MKLLKTLSLLVLPVSVLFSGCIDDDRNDCPPDHNVVLTFSYPDFAEHIGCVTAAVYDSQSLLVECIQAEKTSLDIFQGIRLGLPAGDYTAVCWGNTFSNTQINGLMPGNGLLMQKVASPGYFSSTPVITNDSLYYGIRRFTVNQNTTTNETIAFTPAYIRLIIQIKGLGNTATGAPSSGYPYIKVNNLAPSYDYTMVAQGNLTTYYPFITVDPARMLVQSTCNILRFNEENPITIEVVENHTDNTVLHTVDLQSFIAANSIKIIEGKEVVIPILISFETGVTVTLIEGWSNTPVNPEPQQ